VVGVWFAPAEAGPVLPWRGRVVLLFSGKVVGLALEFGRQDGLARTTEGALVNLIPPGEKFFCRF